MLQKKPHFCSVRGTAIYNEQLETPIDIGVQYRPIERNESDV